MSHKGICGCRRELAGSNSFRGANLANTALELCSLSLLLPPITLSVLPSPRHLFLLVGDDMLAPVAIVSPTGNRAVRRAEGRDMQASLGSVPAPRRARRREAAKGGGVRVWWYAVKR